jgi:hypothetical protein
LLPVTNKEFLMRKLTPEERAAKKALAHVHTADCEHAVLAVTVAETPVAEEAPVAEPVAEEAPTEEVVEEKPKRKYTKKSEEATEEAPAEEA